MSTGHKDRRSFKRLIVALKYSLSGLRAAWSRESAFRLEAIMFGAGVPSAFYIGAGTAQIGFLIGSLLALLIVEILNSALEAVVDRVGLERHELSRIAKDLGSAAVLLTALFPISIWAAAFLRFFGIISI